jgi:membrane-bound serine protease (ClpP class)
MQEALGTVKARTLTYIHPNSGSTGALIAISTREIYMAPISAIGAAAPVSAAGEDLPSTLKDKSISYYSKYFGSVAERNGHNPELAEAFINKERAVKVGGRTIHEAGSVLTLSAQEAVEVVDGKPLLAAGIADSIGDLLRQAKLDGVVRQLQPTGFEQIAFWITRLAPLFLLGGIVGAWIEFKMPGVWLPGIISAFCFATFFAGHYLAGLAGWEAPAMFIIGLALVIGELVIHPGTILPGMLGAVLMVASLLWAMVDRYPEQPLIPASQALVEPLLNLSIAVVLAGVVMALLARYLPKTALFRRLVLATTELSGPSFSPLHSEFTRLATGAQGTALSILRPSGKAQFGSGMYDVITKGEFVDAGSPLRVLAVEGARIVVERT